MNRQMIYLAALIVAMVFLVSCNGGGGTVWNGDCPEPCENGTVCRDGQCVFESDGDTDMDQPLTDGDLETTDGDFDSDQLTDGDLDATEDDTEETSDLADVEVDLGEADLSWDFTMSDCDNNNSLERPLIKLSNNQIDFGAVPIGASSTKDLYVCNAGGQNLSLESIQFAIGTSPEFLKFSDDFPIIIPPGKQAPVYLMYVPLDSQSDNGTLILHSDDPDNKSLEVILISAIKKTPMLKITPQILQFVGATTGDTVDKVFEAKNVGLAPTSVNEILMGLGESSPYEVLEVTKSGEENPSSAPWILDPEDSIYVTILMTMGDEALDDTAYVKWVDSDSTKESTVELTTSDAALCAVADAGEDQVVRPLSTVRLDGSDSYDPNGSITEYKWEFVAIPPDVEPELKSTSGEVIQGLWFPEPNPTLFAESAGEYELKLTVKDETDEGCTELNQDNVVINVVPDETIHIQLLWSDPKNDFDLHLIKPGGTHSRDCGKAENDTDCCWSNCSTNNGTNTECPERGCPGPANSPNWSDPNSREDDPTLDIDDKEGRGPENINLSLPEVGDYTVTVENFKASSTSQVMVRVYIFGTLRNMFIAGTDNNSIPQHYHWNVCYIRVNSASDIEVIPIDNSIVVSE